MSLTLSADPNSNANSIQPVGADMLYQSSNRNGSLMTIGPTEFYTNLTGPSEVHIGFSNYDKVIRIEGCDDSVDFYIGADPSFSSDFYRVGIVFTFNSISTTNVTPNSLRFDNQVFPLYPFTPLQFMLIDFDSTTYEGSWVCLNAPRLG